MNLPNRLTLLRIVMIPVFLWFLLNKTFEWGFLWAFITFALASLTDMFDGRIARRNGLVTDFGKLMDPLADKLLVTSALIALLGLGLVPPLAVILIMAREFTVTSIRLVAAPRGRVIAADVFGKIKTVLQMVWILFLLLYRWGFDAGLLTYRAANAANLADRGLMLLTVALTVLSGMNYLIRNRDLFLNTM